ncbi:MAG: tetratricopeptide repeat protein [Xanthomonadales bacterium]|nr:tetratricopeptide repeat protein [Xanthomonadales bacterium]
MQTLLNELKRRNIFRASAAYVVTAWVLAQGAGLVLPAFDSPDWLLRAVFVILAIGFPVTITAAWLYEITPRGLRRTSTLDHEQRKLQESSGPRIVDSITIIALVFAVVLVGIGRDGWLIGMQLITAEDVSTLMEANGEEQTVAVVPFVSLNPDPDHRLLAEGFATALADRLQSASSLRVIGMSSTFELNGDDSPGAELHSVLNVDRIVEGSLRRSGDLLIITAQLVRHLDHEALATHSEQVPPAELDEALERIARNLASAAGARLAEANGTDFTGGEAEDWFRVLGALRHGGKERLQKARELTASLSEKAPQSGEVQAARGVAILRQAQIDTADHNQQYSSGHALLERAISLAPESRRVLRWRTWAESQAAYRRGRAADFAHVLDNLDHALVRFPGDPVLLGLRARHCFNFGDFACATESGHRALDINPLDRELQRVMAEALAAMGRTEEAEQTLESMRSIDAPAEVVAIVAARIALARGQPKAALQSLSGIEQPGRQTRLFRLRLLASTGRMEDAVALLTAADDDESRENLSEAWAATLSGKFKEAYRHAWKVLDAEGPENALLLGQLAAQAGEFGDAASAFDRHFSDWLKDPGPLLGPVAWEYAPWYALALRESGREQEANRLLDRHLAGVISVETTLDPASRSLFLAANHAVAGRLEDAANRLEQARKNGLLMTFGALGGLHALTDCRILGEAARSPRTSMVFENGRLPVSGN